jgi:predicted transposase YbfD/YdcC
MNNTIQDYFSEVNDPRVQGRCLHLLPDILLLGLCSYISGGSDYQEMHLFANERSSSLGDLVRLPNGVPSSDTFERVFKSIVPEELASCLRKYGGRILSSLAQKQIVFDGKKLRGVSPTSRGNQGLYLLNVWVSENRFCIAHQKVEDKSNKITAIPDALEKIDITDATVSIDATGTQNNIVELILNKGGHYFLALKENQKSLYEDVECAFKVHSGHDINETIEAGHGRTETPRCQILPAVEDLMEENVERWKVIATIVRIVSTRESKGYVTRDIRYYISDDRETNAAYYNALARGHWGIENQLYWVLDVNFKEDSCRARSGYAPQNLSVLRKMALQIVSNQKDKLIIKKRTYKAALNVGYLKKLIGF